jgi:hypothetical protein
MLATLTPKRLAAAGAGARRGEVATEPITY